MQPLKPEILTPTRVAQLQRMGIKSVSLEPCPWCGKPHESHLMRDVPGCVGRICGRCRVELDGTPPDRDDMAEYNRQQARFR